MQKDDNLFEKKTAYKVHRTKCKTQAPARSRINQVAFRDGAVETIKMFCPCVQ